MAMAMNDQDAGDPQPFQGYGQPTYTPLPDIFLDHQMQDLSEPELRIMLYIFRRTFGFKKQADAVSYSQFLGGITTRAGKQLDRGAGVSKSSLWRCLKSLVERGLIFQHKSSSEEGNNAITIYELNIDGKPHYAPSDSEGTSKEGWFPTDTRGSFPQTPGVVSHRHQGGGFPQTPTTNSINQQTVQDSVNQQQQPEPAHAGEIEIYLKSQSGVLPKAAERMAKMATEKGRDLDYIKAWEEWIKRQPHINNPTAYLIKAISENDDPPTHPRPIQDYATERSSHLERIKASLYKTGWGGNSSSSNQVTQTAADEEGAEEE